MKDAGENGDLQEKIKQLSAIRATDENEKRELILHLNEARSDAEKCVAQRKELDTKWNEYYQKLNQRKMEIEDRMSERSTALYKFKEGIMSLIDSLI